MNGQSNSWDIVTKYFTDTLEEKQLKLLRLITIITTYIYNLVAHFQHQKLKAD